MISKKFKAWIFRFFKDEIEAAHQQRFGLQLPNSSITIGKEEYRFKKIISRKIVDKNYSYCFDRDIYEASLHARHELSKSLYDKVQIKTHFDKVGNNTIVDAYLYVGIKINY